jgi:hypothetical protein
MRIAIIAALTLAAASASGLVRIDAGTSRMGSELHHREEAAVFPCLGWTVADRRDRDDQRRVSPRRRNDQRRRHCRAQARFRRAPRMTESFTLLTKMENQRCRKDRRT